MIALRLVAVLWLTVAPQGAPAQTTASAPASPAAPAADSSSAPTANVESSKSGGVTPAAATPAPAGCTPSAGAPLTAGQIMTCVAANQDRADALRSEYIYHQRIRVLLEKASGKRMRDVTTDYVVTPTPDGTKKELTHVEGYYRDKGRYLAFQGKSEPIPDEDSIDGGMAHDFRDDLLNDKSKDGLASDLFPLTTEHQKDYRFQLLGQEVIHGRPTYRLKFGPKDRSDIDWAGEADIDVADLEPVRVYTKLSRPIPFLMRKFLVDLPGVGFDVEYARQPDGVWFPVSFGTEFRIRVVMFWARNIIVSMSNSDFERAEVQHSVRFEGAAPARPELAAIPISISPLMLSF